MSTRTHTTTGRGALRNRFIRAGAIAATVAVSGALALAAPMSASAADRPESYAKGQFLSGSVLGTDLGSLLKAQFAESHNDGTQGSQTTKDPFKVTALNALNVGGGQSLQLPLGNFLQLGAVGQYAEASKDGSSLGASGAVTDDGAIGVGADKSTPPADATFDLSKLLGSQVTSTLADLKLQLGAVAAQAQGDLKKASGGYNLASAKVEFTSPAIGQLTQKVDSALDTVNTNLGQLTGQGGGLVAALNKLLPLSGSGLNLLGNDVSVTATIDTGNLKDAVQDILRAQYGDGAVSFNLENGTVTIDLAKLLGGKLNNLAPGTELIKDQQIIDVLDGITSTVSTLADQVIAKVKELLNDAEVTITAHAAVSVAQAPIVKDVCHIVQQILPGTGGSGSGSTGTGSGTGGVGGIVGGILGGLGGALGNAGSGGTAGGAVGSIVNGVTGTVGQIVNKTVCDTVSTPVAPKLTQLDVNIDGSVKQLVSGGAATANISLKVLDLVKTNVDLHAVLGGLGQALTDKLFDSDGAITQLTSALDSKLVHPAVSALVGGDSAVPNPVSQLLTKLLSVKVNVQETTTASGKGMAAATGKMFTETAVRVTVLGGVGGSSLATVNLAQATVGPNITTVVPPTCTGTNCTPCTGANCGPDCTTNCGPSGPPSNPTGSSVDHLATTGISIAALVAVMLALLAAGAYLVRESYRRKQLTLVS